MNYQNYRSYFKESEKIMVKCPKCGNTSTKLMEYQENPFSADADMIRCKKCGKEFYYSEASDLGLSDILAMEEGMDRDDWLQKEDKLGRIKHL